MVQKHNQNTYKKKKKECKELYRVLAVKQREKWYQICRKR